MQALSVAIIEPFAGCSHQAWLDGIRKHSKHTIEAFTLPGRHWKWRMHGAAITLAEQVIASGINPDIYLLSDMLDACTFLALLRHKQPAPAIVYFHENQLLYPWSPQDREQTRTQHYEFINYSSALVADHCLFNSAYNHNGFIAALPSFLKQFPDEQNVHTIELIRKKSSILPVGVDLDWQPEKSKESGPKLRILWNHRWEYDKNPEEFFEALYTLKEQGIAFEAAILGESFERYPACFDEAKVKLKDHIVAWGFQENLSEYRKWLSWSSVLPVTSKQEFFGISTVEAIHGGCIPLLPNRLAFPELLPSSLHGGYLYDGTLAALVNKLKDLATGSIPFPEEALEHIQQFSWLEVSPTLDDVLNTVHHLAAKVHLK